ncbi:MAG TPA: FAD-binding protein [Thermoanaerobaculia bacterium]|jgi:FAD/FMN-containing dehydrogenase|nr:FAD-binding protein [Thermoanaerobaculia bacterium]
MAEIKDDSTSEPAAVSRRNFLRGTLAAVAVLGFDPKLRSWATAAELAGGSSLAEGFPHFDGQLLTDDESLTAAADDYGHAVHRRPQAVLRPGSIADVARLIDFARRHDIQVAARGQGHSTLGQAQVAAGVVIDMSSLATIHEVNHGDALVDGGVKWSDLLARTIPLGLAPPTLNDYIELSIGGTLSVGGVGSQAFRQGPQVDNILQLTVVTGRGEIVSCTASHNRQLFDAVRSGLGQFGVIVRARVRLVPAPPQTRYYQLPYTDLHVFLGDLLAAIQDGRFDTVQGFASPISTGGWSYSLEVTKGFTPGHEPNDAVLLAGLHFAPGQQASQDISYFDYLNRLAATVAFLKQIGVWDFPHPWVDLLVPTDRAESFIGSTLDALDPADVGQGPIIIYPYRRNRFRAPNFRAPEGGDTFFLFGLLRTAIPPTPERSAELVAANRALFEQARAVGGFFYPVDSVPMSRQDWRRHFGPRWPQFLAAKKAFDPEALLAPGQGIFNAV